MPGKYGLWDARALYKASPLYKCTIRTDDEAAGTKAARVGPPKGRTPGAPEEARLEQTVAMLGEQQPMREGVDLRSLRNAGAERLW